MRRRDPISNMPNFLEGDWDSVVDYFQEVHKCSYQEAVEKAKAERARFFAGDTKSRIHLFNLGQTLKVWKGRETKPAYAKYGLADPYSDPNNLRNTLVRHMGEGTYWTPATLSDLFERLYSKEAESKFRIARDKRHPIIQRSKFLDIAVWHLAGITPPPHLPEHVLSDEGASAHYLSTYGGKINGLTSDELCHLILELHGIDPEEGYEAFAFAEKEFHNMRNCYPRKNNKKDKTKLGVLWFDKNYFNQDKTNLWYDAISAQPVLRERELEKLNHRLKTREELQQAELERERKIAAEQARRRAEQRLKEQAEKQAKIDAEEKKRQDKIDRERRDLEKIAEGNARLDAARERERQRARERELAAGPEEIEDKPVIVVDNSEEARLKRISDLGIEIEPKVEPKVETPELIENPQAAEEEISKPTFVPGWSAGLGSDNAEFLAEERRRAAEPEERERARIKMEYEDYWEEFEL